MSQHHAGLNLRDLWSPITQAWTMNQDRYLVQHQTHINMQAGLMMLIRFMMFFFIPQKHMFMRKNLRQSKLLDPSPQAITQTHREFVDGLLSECRLKVRALINPL